MNRQLLYVDDEHDNLIVFRSTFDESFDVLTASSGQEALALLERSEIPVIVADQRMPGMTGVEFLELVRVRHPYSIRIILTGYTDAAAMMDAINKGHVYSFVTKPWEREPLLSILLRAFPPRTCLSCAGISAMRSKASASSSGCDAFTTSPASPTISDESPTSVTMHGSPHAIASAMTFENPSDTDDETSTSRL